VTEIWFGHADRRVPFLWESRLQPAGRWHAEGRGPAQYLADTPEGAWAEFLRREEITDPAEVAGIARSLWAVEIERGVERLATPSLPDATARGGLDSCPACRSEADQLRAAGATGIEAVSAALVPAGAAGEFVDGAHLRPAPPRDGRALCLFGPRPELRGHRCVEDGAPPAAVLALVRHL
jgi:hypothetical protein